MCNVRKVRIEGVSIRNAANYAILGYDVSKGRIRHIRIEGGWDGVHIRGCRNVRLEDSYLSTGDDAIAGGYWDGLTVRNCILNSSCNGIRMIEPSDCFTLEDTAIYGPGLHPHITSGKHSSDAAVSIEPGGWGPAPGKVGTVTLKRLTISHVLTPLSVTLAEGNDMERLVAMNINARATTRMALSVKAGVRHVPIMSDWRTAAWSFKVSMIRCCQRRWQHCPGRSGHSFPVMDCGSVMWTSCL